MPSVGPFCSDVSRENARAARRHRQPRRPLDPGRVPRALEPRRGRGQRALRPGQGAPPRAGRGPRRTRSSSSSGAPSGAASPSSRVLGQLAGARRRALPRRDRGLRGPARPRPDRARRAARPSAAARLHARQARPRAARATAGRSTRRSRSRPRTTGSGRSRTSAATASRATSSSCRTASTSGASAPGDAWPVLDEYLAGRIDLEHYRGRSCYSFAEQAAERAVREAAGLRGHRRPRAGRPRGRARRLPRRRPRLRGRRHLRARRADLSDVHVGDAQAPAALRRRNPSRISRLTSTRRLSSSSCPGSSAAVNGSSALARPPRARRGRARGTSGACPRRRASSRRRSAITVGRRSSGVSTVIDSSARTSSSWPSRIGRRLSHELRACPACDVVRRRAARPAARCRSTPDSPSSGTERRNSTSSAHSSSAGAERVDPRVHVDPDRDVQRVGLRGERVVQPAAREVERVAGAQRQLEHRRAGLAERRRPALRLQRQLEQRVVDPPVLLARDLEHEDVVRVVVDREALRAARRVVRVRLHRAVRARPPARGRTARAAAS